MGRGRSPGWVGSARRTVVGSSCRWQFSFRREGQKRPRHQSADRDLEQVDGTYALRESAEAYRGQFDSNNEALRPGTHTFMGENYRTCGNLAWFDSDHRRRRSRPQSGNVVT
jgi:hypothetical protein